MKMSRMSYARTGEKAFSLFSYLFSTFFIFYPRARTTNATPDPARVDIRIKPELAVFLWCTGALFRSAFLLTVGY
jgi:hypothetical protein